MEDKKMNLLKCWLRTFATYALLSFGWLAFLSIGMTAESTSNAVVDVVSSNALFAERLLSANLYIALFSAIFGFSALLFQIKNIPDAAKRSLHILANYVAAMVCFYGLHSSAKDVAPKMWITLIFIATLLFFVIYGVGVLAGFLIKKIKK